MTRRFINQLGERESINEVFLAGDKQLRKNRNGNLYLQMRLTDRTGSVNALMWNTSDSAAHAFDNGDFVRVDGITQFYNGSLQIIANRSSGPNQGTSIERNSFGSLRRTLTGYEPSCQKCCGR